MNRDEYLAMLDAEPATPNQRGAIMGYFERLGFDPRRDRAERLAICAALLDLDALGSTAELTMGQAGQLVNLLQRIGDRAELPVTTAPLGRPVDPDDAGPGDEFAPRAVDGQDHDDGEPISIAEAIGRIAVLIAMAVYGRDFLTKSSDPDSAASGSTTAAPDQLAPQDGPR